MKTSLDNLLDRYNSNRELLYVGLVVLWSACLLYFNPRLLALLSTATDVFSAGAVIIFTLCLDFFWLYMLYHVLMITVSCWVRWKHPSQNLVPVETIVPVAILYPTRNDFRPVSAMSCLNLDYPDFHVFILDDSTDKEFRKNIDEWARTHTDKVTVIRREDKSGYKAGNLNHALETIGKDYPYFAICDADGILPRDFLTGLLPFLQDKRVAYVQALQKGNPDQPEFFGQVLNFMIEAHYRYYVEAKNYFGFVMFYGHGGLLKTSVWQEAGGFPEIASEDLAYSARARALGYRGVYTDTVICLEDFPPGLPQLRKRSEKWIRGTSEFVKKFFWP
ncbi:MAG: glycosyltransferase, partial [Candidatus Omnitrophica bacterium]|nr:glycosyltransferase [Candidatus Omnitrophota bacterium]